MTTSLTDRLWEKIGRYPHHGLCILLSSLRTEKNCGVGEFLDLLELIPFCTEIGFDVIQLLPINDTGLDNTPYSALSSCALNPIYLSLWALPHLTPSLKTKLDSFNRYQNLTRLAYESIYKEKEEFLHEYCESTYPHFQSNPDFLSFVETNLWLKPYGLFKILKKRYAYQSWTSWDPDLASPSHTTLKKLYAELEEPINVHILIQYLCHLQMKTVKSQATASRVFLIGDIPILINPESLDVWLYRENFNLNYTAGAPPDMYSEEGQNWGFPILDWDAVVHDQFTWWRDRLRSAAQYYDIYRIDHIIGLYRIWAIEKGQKAMDGIFIPPEKWQAIPQGEMILSKLTSLTDMLPIGEDLGVDIAEIRASMLRLGIPSLKIPRWERYYEKDGSFIPYTEYSPFSLTAISTHDSETLYQWWQSSPEEAQSFSLFNHIPFDPELSFQTRYQILKHAHKTPSFFHINLIGEYLALFPQLISQSPSDERINIPGTFSSSNWSYRLRPTLEKLNSHQEIKKALRSLSA